MKDTPLAALAEKARTAKSSEDFAAVIALIDADIAEVERQRVEIEGTRETVIFEGGDLNKLRRSLTDLVDQRANLEAMRSGAVRRKEEAAKREDIEAVDADAAKAAQLGARLFDVYKQRVTALVEVRATLAEADAIETELRGVNDRLEAAGAKMRRTSAEAMFAKASPQQHDLLNRPLRAEVNRVEDAAMIKMLNGQRLKLDRRRHGLGASGTLPPDIPPPDRRRDQGDAGDPLAAWRNNGRAA